MDSHFKVLVEKAGLGDLITHDSTSRLTELEEFYELVRRESYQQGFDDGSNDGAEQAVLRLRG